MRARTVVVGGLAALLSLSAGAVEAQTILLDSRFALDAPVALGDTMQASTVDRQAVLESSAPEIVSLSEVVGRPSWERLLEARSPGQATLRARVDGVVVDELVVEVQTPDEMWWAMVTIPTAPGRETLALVEGEELEFWMVCAAEGRALHGFPPDLAWVAGGESYLTGGFGSPKFEHAGGTVPRGVHATSFTSTAWSLPGPQLEVLGADEVTVSFVTERRPHHMGFVQFVLTRADGSVVEGGRISTPTGFGYPSAQESPPGYHFRRDPDASTTFTFLLGDTEHPVQVAGHPTLVLEGPIGGGGGGGCAIASTEDASSSWFALALFALVALCRPSARSDAIR